MMIYSYLKIALRNIKKYRGYSLISISGLAVGLASCILIMAWVLDELSYDTHFENAENIYRITYAEEIGGKYDHYALSSFAAAPAFKQDLPEVFNYTRIYDAYRLISYNDKKFSSTLFLYTDSTFFEIFKQPFLAGNPKTALNKPNSVVISSSFSEKVFGSEDPLGKVISVSDNKDMIVRGIVRDLPENTHFKFDCIASLKPIQDQRPWLFTGWLGIAGWSYLELQENVDTQAIESKLNIITQKYAGERAKQNGTRMEYHLQNLKDIHLKSNLQAEMGMNGDINQVFIFSIVALFILLIALINFINLSTARSGTRRKEIGIRKVLGANRLKLISQFFSESNLISFISLIFALLLVHLFLPLFNSITNKNIDVNNIFSPVMLLGIAILMILCIFGAGSFPALVLSKFNPVVTLKGVAGNRSDRSAFRNILVVVQFAISTILIISTIIVIKQLDFMKNTNPGFNKDQVMVVKIRGKNIRDNFETFKNELLQNTNIQNAVYSWGIPGNVNTVLTMFKEGHDAKDSHTIDVIRTDFDFIETYGMQVIKGRSFSPKYSSDTSNVFIVNEAAAIKFGWDMDALGRKIGFSKDRNKGEIVGIVKDFHYRSLKDKINPMVFALNHQPARYLSLKINTDQLKETISFIEKKWNDFEKERSFDYFFTKEHFNSLYKTEEKVSMLVNLFAGFAIFIASIGLLGLAAFTIEQRTKEIGIRKVLGASVNGIMFVLSKQLTIWVLIANIIAWPSAYFIMREWLQNFAYRTNINIWIFIISGFLALFIAVFITSFQTIKAAIANPVDSLKYE